MRPERSKRRLHLLGNAILVAHGFAQAITFALFVRPLPPSDSGSLTLSDGVIGFFMVAVEVRIIL